jgi:hypothetical protein
MRSILFLCFLASNFRGHAAIAERFPPAQQLKQPGIPVEKSRQTSMPARRFMAKNIAKIAAVFPGKSYGKGSAIAGLGCAAAVVVSWLLSPYLGLFLTIPFATAGLILSIMAMSRSRRYYRNKLATGLALAGIILNGLLLGAFFSLLLWAAS